MLDLQIKDMKRYITAPIIYLFYFHILCSKMKCISIHVYIYIYIYISLGRNTVPRFNTLLKSDSENLPTSQDTLHCIKAVLCCSALPPYWDTKAELCCSCKQQSFSSSEAGRERGGGVGRAENERRCVILLKHIFPQRSFLYLFLDSKLNHSINRWAYFVMIMYSAFQPLCVVYLIFFFTRALSLPLIFHLHFLLAD